VQYQIEFNKTASKELLKISAQDRNRIAVKISNLAANPLPVGSKKLAGLNSYYRIRIGNYRVIYKIENDRLVILVVAVGHRREVYRGF
jgi:mRNA interferase RelE/StbE